MAKLNPNAVNQIQDDLMLERITDMENSNSTPFSKHLYTPQIRHYPKRQDIKDSNESKEEYEKHVRKEILALRASEVLSHAEFNQLITKTVNDYKEGKQNASRRILIFQTDD